jgi:hypothetical protein
MLGPASHGRALWKPFVNLERTWTLSSRSARHELLCQEIEDPIHLEPLDWYVCARAVELCKPRAAQLQCEHCTCRNSGEEDGG